jgi:hypothetical protein
MPRQAKQQIQWTNEKRNLTQLIPWPRNPRQIKGAQVKRLQDSFEEFGQPEQIVIGPANELYNGHQRLKSWLSEFGDIEIDVRVSSRPLSEKEREKLTVYLHKGAVGEWDFDILGNEFELDELLEWGFEPFELGLDDGDESQIDLDKFFEKVTDDYEAKQGYDRIILEYTTEDAEIVKQALKERNGTPENIVWELLGL